ncbi:hypothetical protein [Atlantibacter hermannii]|uniref:hypothetical protein n=1 Tax=Atlantibacter hermannii TaxID=565 RepID=UPI003075FB9E
MLLAIIENKEIICIYTSAKVTKHPSLLNVLTLSETKVILIRIGLNTFINIIKKMTKAEDIIASTIMVMREISFSMAFFSETVSFFSGVTISLSMSIEGERCFSFDKEDGLTIAVIALGYIYASQIPAMVKIITEIFWSVDKTSFISVY